MEAEARAEARIQLLLLGTLDSHRNSNCFVEMPWLLPSHRSTLTRNCYCSVTLSVFTSAHQQFTSSLETRPCPSGRGIIDTTGNFTLSSFPPGLTETKKKKGEIDSSWRSRSFFPLLQAASWTHLGHILGRPNFESDTCADTPSSFLGRRL